MTRDANQIAQEAARREGRWLGDQLQPPRPPTGGPYGQAPAKVPSARVGTLTIWRSGNVDEVWTEQMEEATVQVSPSGWLIAEFPDGSKSLMFPEPGWRVDFLPDDAGE